VQAFIVLGGTDSPTGTKIRDAIENTESTQGGDDRRMGGKTCLSRDVMLLLECSDGKVRLRVVIWFRGGRRISKMRHCYVDISDGRSGRHLIMSSYETSKNKQRDTFNTRISRTFPHSMFV